MDMVRVVGIGMLIVGAIFALFPGVVSQTAILMIAIAMMSAGIYMFVKNRKSESGVTNFFAGLIGLAGLVIFLNPGIILFVIGFSCIISGVGGLLVAKSASRSILYPIILVILGIYATMNTQGAGSAVFLIIGVVLIVIGLMLVIKGKDFIFSRVVHFDRSKNSQNFYHNRSNTSVDEDIIDVDFSEKED